MERCGFCIIGVVKDFNFNSPRNNISPLSLVLGPKDNNSVLCVRLSTFNLPATLDKIESKWQQLVPQLRFGLFGLAAYAAEQRRKEISIRKVLGASAAGIPVLLSRELIKWIVLSFCVAAPLAGWVMHRWLQGFAYRTGISGWLFLVGGTLAILIAFVTVSLQSYKAATANPVENLRAE
jgi:putative ABC transport system permease protein